MAWIVHSPVMHGTIVVLVQELDLSKRLNHATVVLGVVGMDYAKMGIGVIIM
jgi:hypothetical protein